MTRHVEAVYENGVLRPLEPLALNENQRVRVTVADLSDDPLRAHLDLEYVERVEKEVAAMDSIPSLEEVRAITAKDPSSWADSIIAEREE